MNVKFKRTVFIPANIETVWNTIMSDDFERDFFPEISRKFDAQPDVAEMDTVKSIMWQRGPGIDIELTRKDLNVTIDSVELKLQPSAGGVNATVCVVYSKLFEQYFIKAHKAVRNLFSIKLNVLKSDCIDLTSKQDLVVSASLGN